MQLAPVALGERRERRLVAGDRGGDLVGRFHPPDRSGHRDRGLAANLLDQPGVAVGVVERRRTSCSSPRSGSGPGCLAPLARCGRCSPTSTPARPARHGPHRCRGRPGAGRASEPGAICVIPVPIAIEHAEPGGVSCTTRNSSPRWWSTCNVEAHLLDVERLGTIDVRDGDHDEFELSSPRWSLRRCRRLDCRSSVRETSDPSETHRWGDEGMKKPGVQCGGRPARRLGQPLASSRPRGGPRSRSRLRPCRSPGRLRAPRPSPCGRRR